MKLYRCGWCGTPADADGVPLLADKIPENINDSKYTHIQLNGECCPNSNPDREMSTDERAYYEAG